ncbi:MAG: Ezrin/radixin/moesin family protein [Cytophagaceae bacterium]
MKKILFIVLALVGAYSASAQMTKEEQKEWAKRLKALTPEQYKKLVQDKEALSQEVEALKNDKVKMNADLVAKQQEIDNLKKQMEQQTQPTAVQPAGGSAAGSTVASAKGIVYKVQIGAFKNKDLSKYFNNNKNFSGDVEPDGTKKYTLGSFTDYWEADNFKKYLREMGVKDAWVVAYKDGKRINLKDALEGVVPN